MFPDKSEPLAVRGFYDAETLILAGHLLADTLRTRRDDMRVMLISVKKLRENAVIANEFTMVRTSDLNELLAVPRALWSN